MLKKKKLIIFDIDGTLTDSVKIHQKAFTESLYEIGVEEINSQFKEFKHHTDSYILKSIYEDDQKEPISESKKIIFENVLTLKIEAEKFNEIKGARHLIETLVNSTDYGICYATGSLRKAAEHKLNSLGIKFDERQLVASDKIHEREIIVEKAIENAKSFYLVNEFERIISVGDGLWDLITAQKLIIEFIGVGVENKEILKKNGATIVFDDLTEFEI